MMMVMMMMMMMMMIIILTTTITIIIIIIIIIIVNSPSLYIFLLDSHFSIPSPLFKPNTFNSLFGLLLQYSGVVVLCIIAPCFIPQ